MQEVEQPGERVGSRVLAGEQHDEDVAGDVAVVDLAARHVGGDDHRFEQIARAAAQRRIVAQALPRLGDEALDRRLHFADAALERVGRPAARRSASRERAPASGSTAPERSG